MNQTTFAFPPVNASLRSFLDRIALSAIAVAILVISPAIPAHAQAGEPLSLFRNYFVSGDYVVGSVGLRGLGDSSGFATGTITIPDPQQPNAKQVPAGADIVAAFLYWETVQSTQISSSGQNGFFNGFPVVGTNLGNPNAPVSWSSGGCSGAANGSKTVHAYRADVRPFLNVDSLGRVIGNGSYVVKLPDSGSNGGGVPLTLGATLIVIYRVLSPAVPLNSIVIYDGAFAPVNQAQSVSQDIVGFYDAANTPVAEITHIVGNGQTNKIQTVYLNGGVLPSLYPGQTPFPGHYNASWDSPTWLPNATANDVAPGSSTANTTIVPSSSNSGCVVWGAMVFGTTVQDTDNDGLLDSWETAGGYTDVNTGRFVPLPGADPNTKDVFVEVDYLSNLDGSAGAYKHSHLPKQAAIDEVGQAFQNAPVDCVNGVCKGVHVHFDVGNVYQSPMPGGPSTTCGTQPNQQSCDPYIITNPAGIGGNAISEGGFNCTDSAAGLCEYPGQVSVGWKTGLLYVEDNAQSPNSTPPVGYFDIARKDSYHYVLSGHALGSPLSYWTAYGGGVQDPTMAQLISLTDSNNVATVTLQTPAGIFKPGDPVNPGDPAFGETNLDRVTVAGAIFQPALNGVYQFSSLKTTTTSGISTTTFTIPTTNVPNGTYTYANEPRLAILFAGPNSSSGHSDVGGADTILSFGLWPADDIPGCIADPSLLQPGQNYCDNQVGNVQAQAGTLMHEIGHSFGLTHGATYYPNAFNNPSTSPTYGVNCKPNYLSVMNYLFQIRGFPDGAIDYSRQTLQNLNESALSESVGLGVDLFTGAAAQHPTRWFAPPNAVDLKLGHRTAPAHCDGTPLAPGEQGEVRVDGNSLSAPIDWNNDLITPDAVTSPIDINFDGQIGNAQFQFMDSNDWQNVDFRQIGSRAGEGGLSGGGTRGDLIGGGVRPDLIGGGTPGDLIGGGVTGDLIGGGQRGDLIGGGTRGDLIGGGVEVDFEEANSSVDPARNLTAAQVGHAVVLNWKGPNFGQIRSYQIYRLTGAFNVTTNPFTKSQLLATVTGAPPVTTYTDTSVKNKTTYTYFVVAQIGSGLQSAPSNPAIISVVF